VVAEGTAGGEHPINEGRMGQAIDSGGGSLGSCDSGGSSDRSCGCGWSTSGSGGSGGSSGVSSRSSGKSCGSGGRIGVCMRCRAASALSIMPENEIAITNHKIIHLLHSQPMAIPPSILTFTFYYTSQTLHIPHTSTFPFIHKLIN